MAICAKTKCPSQFSLWPLARFSGLADCERQKARFCGRNKTAGSGDFLNQKTNREVLIAVQRGWNCDMVARGGAMPPARHWISIRGDLFQALQPPEKVKLWESHFDSARLLAGQLARVRIAQPIFDVQHLDQDGRHDDQRCGHHQADDPQQRAH